MADIEFQKAAKASLWYRGDLSWKLRPHQLPIYDFIARGGDRTRTKPATKTVLNISRQTGKSFTAVLYAVEHCLKTKHAHVQMLASTAKQMRLIMIPALKKILEDCPADIAPAASSMDSSWTFPSTGAILRFDGCDNDNAESLRGRSSTLVIFDEAAFIDDLKSVVHDIIMPQFLVTKGRMILISTPPETPDHYFRTMCEDAAEEGAYLKRDVYQNGFATADDIIIWKKEAGGEESTTWKREYLVQFVVDTNRSVFPEFTEECERDNVIDAPPCGPNHCFVGMDVGFKDGTGIIFGYYDFRNASAVIEREVLLYNKEVRTDFLVRHIRQNEKQLWGREPAFRVSDVEPILLNDLNSIHHMSFRPVSKKETKEAGVNEVRMWLSQNRIKIDRRCTQLIKQLKGCIWDKRRLAFDRNTEGHYDLADALVYAIRTLPSVVSLNPWPKYAGEYDPNNFAYLRKRDERDDDVVAFDKIFSSELSEDDEFEDLFR